MAGETRSARTSYNAKVVNEFRATAGQVGGEWAGTPLILVHHVGARTGTEYVTPLGCFPLEHGQYVIVASNGGSPSHPAWYYNLKAHPLTTAEVGAEAFTVAAEELDGPGRAALWPALTARYPTLAAHQAKTTRQFPVFMLTRQG